MDDIAPDGAIAPVGGWIARISPGGVLLGLLALSPGSAAAQSAGPVAPPPAFAAWVAPGVPALRVSGDAELTDGVEPANVEHGLAVD